MAANLTVDFYDGYDSADFFCWSLINLGTMKQIVNETYKHSDITG